MWSTPCSNEWDSETHENQGGIEILVVLQHLLGIVPHSLSVVHDVEVKLRVFVLDGLEVRARGLLGASCFESVRRFQPILALVVHHFGLMLTGFTFCSSLAVVSGQRYTCKTGRRMG